MRFIRHSVFIVDDDADDRESIRDAFMENRHDHDYLFITNGDNLLQKLYSPKTIQAPSIILLDLNMPGKDGKDVLREIKSNEKFYPIPVIVFTTSANEKDMLTSYAFGANCFITKPGTYRDLISVTDSIAKLWLNN